MVLSHYTLYSTLLILRYTKLMYQNPPSICITMTPFPSCYQTPNSVTHNSLDFGS